MKKTLVIFCMVALALFLLPASAFFTVQHPKVQKFLVNEITNMLSDKLKVEVSVGAVRFHPFNRLALHDVYVQDTKGDTLIFVSRLTGALTRLSLSERLAEIGTLRLTDAQLNLEKDTAGASNLTSLIGRLKSSNDAAQRQATTGKPFQLRVHSIETERTGFSYADRSHPAPVSDSAVDFKHVTVTDISLKVSDLNLDGDTMTCHLERLQLKERSGFNLHRLSGVVSVAPTFIEVKKLVIRDDFSDVNAKFYRMDYEQFADFTDYVEKVVMSADFVSSKVDLYTIALFAPKMPKLHLNVGLTGLAVGTVSNLKGRNLTLGFGKDTEVKASVSMQGLPDVQNTFFIFDVKNLASNPDDLFLADNIVLNGKYAGQRALLRQLGALQGKARFTGFLSSFVANGALRSDIGTLISDLSFASAPDSPVLINGTLGTNNFDLGKLVNDSAIGKINFYGKVSGTVASIKNLSLNANLNIPVVELYGYPYRRTKLKGLITENSFRGELLCEDPNMNFDFRGVANFEQEKSQFDFKLLLHHANFAAIGANKRDSLSHLSMEAVANFEGNNVDNFAGKVTINSAKYTSTQGEFPVSSVLLEAKHSEDAELLSLKSDALEASLKAKGGMANVAHAVDSILHRFIPAYHNLLPAAKEHGGAPATAETFEYTFSLLTKNAAVLQQMLLGPAFMVADSASLSGCISSDASCVKLTLNAPAIRYGNLHLSDVNLNSASQGSQLHLSAKAGMVGIDNFRLHDWEMTGTLQNSLLALTSRYKTSIASGQVNAQALFFESRQGKKGVDVELFPSTLVLSDTPWILSQSKIRVEDKRYTISNFRLENDLQLLHVNGVISPDMRDTLSCMLRNLSVEPLLRTLNDKLELTGSVSGEVTVNGLLAPSPLFIGSVQASDVTLFKKPVGEVTLHTSTAENEKDLAVRLSISKDGEENLNVAGTLKPGSEVQALARLNKLNLHHTSPLLAGALSDVDGTLSGDLDVTGPLKRLLLNGKLRIDQGQLKVSYLNAAFSMSGPVAMENSTLQIRSMTVKDDKNNAGKLHFTLANITTPDDLYFSLKVEPDKFHVFNTTERHNDYFYGQGYATGIVQINGGRGETSISVTATTNDKTSLSIPLGSKAQVQNRSFIDFVTPTEVAEVKTEAPTRRTSSNLKVDLNLSVTNDADLMLVLNQNTGDVIKAAGSGNLKMEVEPTKNIFQIFGTYTMQRGEYAISIQNLVNKKFKIDNGSTITFNGEVATAIANIHATYKVRAPLSDLLSDTTTSRYKRIVPIDCKVSMTGRLTAPDLKFEIDAPTADNETRDRMQAQLNTEDNVTIQFLSLLLADRFVPQQDASLYRQNIGGATIGGFVTSQLTELLSHFVDDVNVGFTLNTVDSYSETDWGFSLNANITDRIILNANVERQAQRKQSDPNGSEILGDVDLEMLLDKSGRLRLKAFGHANDQYTEMIAGSNRYGVGIFYQEDFDSLADLWKAIFSKRGKKKADGDDGEAATSQDSS